LSSNTLSCGFSGKYLRQTDVHRMKGEPYRDHFSLFQFLTACGI
jgi:hypothetical protein